MSAAAIVSPAPSAVPSAAPVAAAPVAAALSPEQLAAVERMAERARSAGLVVFGSGHCRAGEFVGCRCWVVSSGSVPGAARIVWLSAGRLLCSCPGRRNPRAFTCSHAQAVRLRLLAESGAIAPASVPSPSAEPRPDRPRCANVPWCGYDLRPDEQPDERGYCSRCAYQFPVPAVPAPDYVETAAGYVRRSSAVPAAPWSSGGGPVVPLCAFCGRFEVRACGKGECPYRRSVGLPLPAEQSAPAPVAAPCVACGTDAGVIACDMPACPAPAPDRPGCPSCGLPADPRELAELGACLSCVLPPDPPDPEPPTPPAAPALLPPAASEEEEEPAAVAAPAVAAPAVAAPAVAAPAVAAPAAHCPRCRREADPDEVTQLGECAACFFARPLRCLCGAAATGETKDGPICDECARQREERVGRLLADAKKAAAKGAAIIERERNRQRRYRTEGRADDPRPAQAKAEATQRRAEKAAAKKRDEAPLLRSNDPIGIFK